MTPMLEMLWEQADPRVVLCERFGLQNADAAAAWVADTVRRHHGLVVEHCERIVLSDSNALAWVGTRGGRFVVKWSVDPARFGRLAALARLTAWLDERGVPVSAPVPALDGRLQIEVDGASLGVQRVMPGRMLDVGDDDQVHEAGAVLARMHAELAACPQGLPGATPPARGLREDVSTWLADAPAHLPAEAVSTLRALVDTAPRDDLPVQLVHGDYRAANILWEGGRVSAVLDLEEARLHHPVADLARASVLLGTLFHDWAPVTAGTRDLFRRGYASVRPLEPGEAAWLDIVVLWSSLVMVPAGADPMGWGGAATAAARLLR